VATFPKGQSETGWGDVAIEGGRPLMGGPIACSSQNKSACSSQNKRRGNPALAG
jgi:hypothetical protein